MHCFIPLKNGNKIYLRPPQLNDLSQILAFINSLADEDVMIKSAQKYTIEEEKKYLQDILEKIENKKMVCLYAFDKKDNFLGSTSIEKQRGRSNHIGLLGIALAKSARGKGLGKIMMHQIIDFAKDELDINQIILNCFVKNLAAINLYKSLGFIQYGYLPSAYRYKEEYVDQVNFYKNI